MQNIFNFFATVEKDKSLQRRIQIAINLDTIVEIAEGYGYLFTSAELQSFIDKITDFTLQRSIACSTSIIMADCRS